MVKVVGDFVLGQKDWQENGLDFIRENLVLGFIVEVETTDSLLTRRQENVNEAVGHKPYNGQAGLIVVTVKVVTF